MKSNPSPTEPPDEAGQNGDSQPEPQKTTFGLRCWHAFWAVAFANLAASFDATMLSVARQTIARDLGGSTTEAFWAGTSYLLSCTILMVI
ncbi:hypothetical protein BBP40_010199 [Aspergillus hancockii]|nr:hypothetical protein BBP40_010199 [Aspergillus hancockii]